MRYLSLNLVGMVSILFLLITPSASQESAFSYSLVMKYAEYNEENDTVNETYWDITDWQAGTYTPIFNVSFSSMMNSSSILTSHYLYYYTGNCYLGGLGRLVKHNIQDSSELVLHERQNLCSASMLDEKHWDIGYYPEGTWDAFHSRSPYSCLLNIENSECSSTNYLPMYWLSYTSFVTPWSNEFGEKDGRLWLGNLESSALTDVFPEHNFQFLTLITLPDETPNLIMDNTPLILTRQADNETNEVRFIWYKWDVETLELSEAMVISVDLGTEVGRWEIAPDECCLLQVRDQDFLIFNLFTGEIRIHQSIFIDGEDDTREIISLSSLTWLPDSSGLIAQLQNTEYNPTRVVRIDLQTNNINPLFEFANNVQFVLVPNE